MVKSGQKIKHKGDVDSTLSFFSVNNNGYCCLIWHSAPNLVSLSGREHAAGD